MIPQQMAARKKKCAGNTCLPAPVPTKGGAGRNADAAPLKIPLYPPFSKGEFLPSQSTPTPAYRQAGFPAPISDCVVMSF